MADFTQFHDCEKTLTTHQIVTGTKELTYLLDAKENQPVLEENSAFSLFLE